MSTASDPSLIDVIVGTFPGLYLIGVGNVAICEIETETLKTISDHVKGKQMHCRTLVGQSDSFIVSVKPILSWKVIETLPNLHSNAICRF